MDNVPVDALNGTPEGFIVAVAVNLGAESAGGRAGTAGDP